MRPSAICAAVSGSSAEGAPAHPASASPATTARACISVVIANFLEIGAGHPVCTQHRVLSEGLDVGAAYRLYAGRRFCAAIMKAHQNPAWFAFRDTALF